jgi:ribonuclease HI
MWADKWRKNNWMKNDNESIMNKKLIKKLYFYYKNLNIKFQHVSSHKKEPEKNTDEHYLWYGNNIADKLANDGADSS